MGRRRRLTRRDIKQKDQVISRMESILAMVSENPRRTAFMLIGVAALLALAIGGYVYVKRQVRTANEGLGEAVRAYQESATSSAAGGTAGADSQQASLDTALERAHQVAEKYGYTGAGRAARLIEASSLARTGKLEEALDTFKGLADEQPRDVIAGAAAMAVAELLGATGKPEEAEQAFRRLAASESPYVPRDVVLLRLAEQLEASDQAAAASEVYRRIVEETPESPHVTQAGSRLKDLEQTLAVAPPDAAAEEPTTAP